MDNKYEEYESEDTEKKKFKLTRGMLLIIGAILLIIIVVIIILVAKSKNKEYVLTKSDCKKLETKMEEEAPVYVENYGIELNDEITRIDLTDLLEENDGTIASSKYPAAKESKGYVNAILEDDEEVYKAYLSCSNLYETKGYVDEDDVVDAKPVIKLKGKKEMTLYVGDTYTEPGATATDEEDGDLTDQIKISGKVDTSKKGTYKVTYTVVDSYGNEVSKKRTVKVKEKTTTTEETTTTETTTTTQATTTSQTTTKVTTRTYSSAARTTRITRATSKNTTKATTTTQRRITTPPTLTLNGSKTVTINKGQNYVDAGATAKDALGTNITSKINKSGTVNTGVAGTYYITYTVKDSYNNMATATRTVIVKELNSVTGISISPNALTISVGGTYTLSAYLTPSNASASISWTSSNSNIATVSNGTVKGISKGTCKITASAGGKSATMQLTVK